MFRSIILFDIEIIFIFYCLQQINKYIVEQYQTDERCHCVVGMIGSLSGDKARDCAKEAGKASFQRMSLSL